MKAVIAFIRLGRFVFLSGGIILYSLGAAIAHYAYFSINWQLYLWGQLIVTCTQLMVHYSNDYYDYAADLLNTTPTRWSGGSRILPNGDLPPRAALYTAIFFGMSASVITLQVAIFHSTGNLFLPLVFLCIFLSWNYSSPPLYLHSHRLGEITGVIVVGIFTPLLGFYLQAGELISVIWLAIIPVALLQFNMLLSVHLPDAEGDAAADKITLVVAIGRQRTAQLYSTILLLNYLLIPLLILAGLPFESGIAAMIPLPLALWLIYRMWRGDWARVEAWDSLAFFSIALLMSTAFLELIAFLMLQ